MVAWMTAEAYDGPPFPPLASHTAAADYVLNVSSSVPSKSFEIPRPKPDLILQVEPSARSAPLGYRSLFLPFF